MIYQNSYEKSIYDNPKQPDYGFGSALGYVPEDAFDLPTITIDTRAPEAPQYSAEFTGQGKAVLVLYTPSKIIAYFDTFADAQTAAEALNNHKGY